MLTSTFDNKHVKRTFYEEIHTSTIKDTKDSDNFILVRVWNAETIQ